MTTTQPDPQATLYARLAPKPKRKYRPGTHNGPSQCIHGKPMATDNCQECWADRGWKDLPR